MASASSPAQGATKSQPSPSGLSSTSSFSFKAPYPVSTVPPASVSALKQRRVSLASPSSPRVVQPWSFRDEMGLDSQSSEGAASSSSLGEQKGRSTSEKKGKIRKIDSSKGTDESQTPEKKARKKWSQEETMMLVNGCQIHGVGNWKTILQDPNLKFHDRTAVDLKDRFRTYFPDAYKKHYPNAKTHLSNKIRSTFPDGSSLFEKTRSKRRRPFTEAEDAALKAGYEKHGTTWATIVKDPIFQEQNRRSTDLRDRFRNAFPHLYQAAGYKPRSTIKKKADGPVRAADDNLSQMSTAGPVRSRRRAQSSTGFLRGGTKSVPQSTACSEDEDSSGGEEEEDKSPFKKPATPPLFRNKSSSTSPSPYRSLKSSPPNVSVATPSSISSLPTPASAPATSSPPTLGADAYMETMNDDVEYITIETESLNIPDFLPSDTHSDMENIETWSSGANTPTHSSTAAWSTAGASPTTSHLSDFLLNNSGGGVSNNPSNTSSPFINRRNDFLGGNMIGKSAWGQDWFSPNPRLDASSGSISSTSSSSFIDHNGNFSPAPGSPFSFHPHLNHGVLDRYDLFPPSMPADISSEAGIGDSHTTFSDDDQGGAGASAGGTGFKGYHSQIAGDLISSGAGAGSRMQSFASMPLSLAGLYNSQFALSNMNLNSFGSTGSEIMGLGLEGIPEDAGGPNSGSNAMQLDGHTTGYSSITDELGLTGISLDDNHDSSTGSTASGSHLGQAIDATMEDLRSDGLVSGVKEKVEPTESSMLSDHFSLEDLVDMSNGQDQDDEHDLEQNATPPATPLMTHSRSRMRSSQAGGSGQGSGGHHRSISVPPTEARNAVGDGMSVGNGNNSSGYGNYGVPMSMDDVGVGLMHSHPHGHHHHPSYYGHPYQSHPNSPPHGMNQSLSPNLGRGLENLFATSSNVQSQSRMGRSSELMRSGNAGPRPIATTSISSPALLHAPHTPRQQPRVQPQHVRHQSQPQAQAQNGSMFSSQLMLSPALNAKPSSSSSTPSHTPHSHPSRHHHGLSHGITESQNTGSSSNPDVWRMPATAAAAPSSWMNSNSLNITSPDFYNVPYLDLHYATYGMAMAGQQNANGGEALDLAQSAAMNSSTMSSGQMGVQGMSLSSLGLNLAFGNNQSSNSSVKESTPSPFGTIRMQHHSNHNSAKQGSSQLPPSDSFASVAAALAAASSVGQSSGISTDSIGGLGMGSFAGLDITGTGTIRQSHFKNASSNQGLGRSMSHHRGQSAVCPQDLMLKTETNKRKRASWDGGLV
ncbi:hypothetical protein CPB83DRAFT_864185 [Crepidotus variabilis]|uniref:Meiotically up-regulated gene 152 protein n=1 Tax=Crepidotus variabilis TaxID=179855 RepID=A0A9P6E524_9AGAR|nr:hypothetical protein CPB83DRAFT_864185 [Crepidotus variabilis]